MSSLLALMLRDGKLLFLLSASLYRTNKMQDRYILGTEDGCQRTSPSLKPLKQGDSRSYGGEYTDLCGSFSRLLFPRTVSLLTCSFQLGGVSYDSVNLSEKD